MRSSARGIFVAALIALSVSACSTAQLAQLQGGLSNFVAGVQSVNSAISQVSTTLATNCNGLQSAATNLALLGAAISPKVGPALAAANSSIVAWCQDPPTDIASAIKATAAQIVAAQAAYKAAKNGS